MVASIPAPQSGPFPGTADAGSDADDSWVVGEIGETASFIVDRIAEDRKFLADLNDDNFDFQQWYDEQMDDFKADQDNVAYDNPDDRLSDLNDFTEQLNEISTEFASSQGEDYANFVRDIIGEGIDHLHEQAEELLERLQETANDINDLEEQEYDLYIQMSKISCVDSGYNVIVIDTAATNVASTTTWPGKLSQNPPGNYPPVVPPTNILPKSSCALDQLTEELTEAYKKYNAVGASNGTKTKYRKKINAYQKKWRDYVRKWQKAQHTFVDVQQKEDHEETEYGEYELLLSVAQGLQEAGMQGSDSLVLPDSRVPLPTGVPTD